MEWQVANPGDILQLPVRLRGKAHLVEGQQLVVQQVSAVGLTLVRPQRSTTERLSASFLNRGNAATLRAWGAPDDRWLVHVVGLVGEDTVLRFCRAQERIAVGAGVKLLLVLDQSARPGLEQARKQGGCASVPEWIEREFTLPDGDGAALFVDAGEEGVSVDRDKPARLIGRHWALHVQNVEFGRPEEVAYRVMRLSLLDNPAAAWGGGAVLRVPAVQVSTEPPDTLKQPRILQQGAGGRWTDMWSRYRRRDELRLKQQIAETERVEYLSWTHKGGRVVEFQLADRCPMSWYDVSELTLNAVDPEAPEQEVYAGAVIKLRSSSIRTHGARQGLELPTAGFLQFKATGKSAINDRRKEALSIIEARKGPLPNLVDLLNDPGSALDKPDHEVPALSESLLRYLDRKHLTVEQEQAVGLGLNTPDLALIGGVAGAGKTMVIRALIHRLNELGIGPILVSSFQHVAVDNALQGVAYQGIPALRLGGRAGADSLHQMQPFRDQVIADLDAHLTRLREGEKGPPGPHQVRDQLERILLEYVSHGALQGQFDPELIGPMQAILADLELTAATGRDAWYAALKRFQDRIAGDNDGLVRMLKRRCAAIGVTCQQAARANYDLRSLRFAYVIIEDAPRATPLDLMIPLSMGRRIILVGDPHQLVHAPEPLVGGEPAALTQGEEDGDLQESLFQHLWEGVPPFKKVMLHTQFRMNPTLSNLVRPFYPEGIEDAGNRDSSLPLSVRRYAHKPLVWVKVRRKGAEKPFKSDSFINREEAAAIAGEVRALLAERPDLKRDSSGRSKIGIITFYRDQVEEIQKALGESLQECEVGTAFTFQGSEFEVVFLSTVRSNSRKETGPAGSENQLCAALSRAEHLLVIVGDPETMAHVKQLQKAWAECERGAGHVALV